MSRSFMIFLQPFLKSLNSFVLGSISLGTCICHGAYALGTFENKMIKINNKYKFDRNGSTEFMIIDDNGKHYNVNNSFWYWKWDSIEDWHYLETNKDIIIKYYGWRVPLFGLFPNIIMSKQDKVLNSMSRADYWAIAYNRNEKKQNSE